MILNETAASDVLGPKLVELLGLPKNMRKMQITLERFEPIKISGETLEGIKGRPGSFTVNNYACEIHLLDPNVKVRGAERAATPLAERPSRLTGYASLLPPRLQ